MQKWLYMKIDILTLFPEMFSSLKESILGRALEKGAFEVNLINIRDFSLDKHKKVDDYIFGGGDGMLMTPQPLYDAIMSVKTENSYVVYMSPKGSVLKQNKVKEIQKSGIIDDVLKNGAERASYHARKKLSKVYRKVGLR